MTYLENGEFPMDEYGNVLVYRVYDFYTKVSLLIKDKFGLLHFVACLNTALPACSIRDVRQEDVVTLVKKFGHRASRNIAKQIDKKDARYSIRPCESPGMHQ